MPYAVEKRVAHWVSMGSVIWRAGMVSRVKDMVNDEKLRLLCGKIGWPEEGRVAMMRFR